MADQATAEKDKAKEAKDAAAAPAKAKGGGLLGPLLAGVVLVGVGAGLGMWLSSLVKGVQQEAATAAAGDTKAGAGHGHGGEAAKGHDPEPKAEELSEVAMPDLVSNVRNQQGRRYIKLTCSFWVPTAELHHLGLGEAEGAGGGGGNIKRMVQMALEEHLKHYDLDELTGPNIYSQLKRGFKDQIEKSLRELHPELPRDHELVSRVVLTNLLVQ
jgi:flagellar basal body-associated protein FliL